jgi:hypothetical protein
MEQAGMMGPPQAMAGTGTTPIDTWTRFMTPNVPTDSQKNMGTAAMFAGNALRGQEQQRAMGQQGVFAPAPPLNPNAGGGQSFMSGAPQGTTINTMPGGTLPTAMRFAQMGRKRPSNNYSDYGLG